MLTYLKSTMRVRRMKMHLSSGHVTLVQKKFYSHFNYPQSDKISSCFPLRVIFELRLAIAAKFLHDASNYVQFYNSGPKFWRAIPKNFY